MTAGHALFSKRCPAVGRVDVYFVLNRLCFVWHQETVLQLTENLCYPSAPNSENLSIIENHVAIVVTVASPSSNRIYVGVVAETLPALRLLRPLISLLSGVPGKDTSTCTWTSCASSSCSGSPVNTGHATGMKKQSTQNDSHESLLQWKPRYGHLLIMTALFVPAKRPKQVRSSSSRSSSSSNIICTAITVTGHPNSKESMYLVLKGVLRTLCKGVEYFISGCWVLYVRVLSDLYKGVE